MGRIDYLLHQFNANINPLDNYMYSSEPYWHGRLWAQMDFLHDVSALEGGRFDDILLRALEQAYRDYRACGTVTREICQAAEACVEPAWEACKAYRAICVGHAHIDMNWMWSFDETVSVTLATFRTMLKLMEEDPDFTFGQSQAFCYRIVEQYGEPELLEDIRRRVKEGRWEVTASTWVEADKNMPSLESMARHALYTKTYLSRLLDLPLEAMHLDFEPDTFGQSVNVPEVARNAGVRYYYHNRGTMMDSCFSRWQAPSGASVLVYRDTQWYNARVDSAFMRHGLRACRDSGQKTMLKIYGVGDHGGGPTRRDIARIRDRMTWPVYPTLKFGTYEEFFSTVDRDETCIPVVSGERNPVFTGCYTTQTRLKEANRVGERVLGEGEKLCALDMLATGHPYPTARFAEAWQHVLFSQFHDILTGSCVRDAREYARGTFQQTMAQANTQRSRALRHIAQSVDTAAFLVQEDLREDTAMGAGVGFGSGNVYSLAAPMRSGRFGNETNSEAGGNTRIFTVFNSAAFPRTALAELTVWDWPEKDVKLMRFTLPDGTVLPHQVISSGYQPYWSHCYVTAAVQVQVPACGYTTVILRQTDDVCLPHPWAHTWDELEHTEDRFILENDLVRITLDTVDGTVSSYFDKEQGRELLDPKRRGGSFRFIWEDVDKGMSAWVDGRYMSVEPLTKGVRIRRMKESGPLRQCVQLEVPVAQRSSLRVVLSLDAGSKALSYSCVLQWHELGTGEQWPQLNFSFPLPYRAQEYLYQVPGGMLSRSEQNIDMPSIGFIAGVDGDEARGGWMLTTDSKYGLRGTADSMSVTLIRSSTDPDPNPENGQFQFRITLEPMAAFTAQALYRSDYAANNPLLAVVDAPHAGTLPLEGGLLELEQGSCVLQAVKADEATGKALVLRLSEVEGLEQPCVLNLCRPPKSAVPVDFCEQPLPGTVEVEGSRLRFTPRPYTQQSILVTF